jgi:hypothetical protein
MRCGVFAIDSMNFATSTSVTLDSVGGVLIMLPCDATASVPSDFSAPWLALPALDDKQTGYAVP